VRVKVTRRVVPLFAPGPKRTLSGHHFVCCRRPVGDAAGALSSREAQLGSPRPLTILAALPSPPRSLRLSGATLRRIFLFAPRAPAVQVFIPAMRALDCSQLIIERRRRFVARCRSCNSDNLPARPALTQPSNVDLARYHLLRCPDIDVAQWG
jgi:hypothetical protein